MARITPCKTAFLRVSRSFFLEKSNNWHALVQECVDATAADSCQNLIPKSRKDWQLMCN